MGIPVYYPSGTLQGPNEELPTVGSLLPWARGYWDRPQGYADGGGDGPTPPLPAVGPAPLGRTSQNAASWPIRARFNVISCKVKQNGQVSPKYVQKASHSPYIQNRVKNSPLEILRFPVSSAFSHKELMTHY